MTDTIKQESRKRFEVQLRTLGRLTEEEIRELSDFEYEAGPETVTAQLRRYYLKLKAEQPERADVMWDELPVIDDRVLTEEEVIALCHILYRYWSGFIIYFQGKSYTKSSRPVAGSSVHYV